MKTIRSKYILLLGKNIRVLFPVFLVTMLLLDISCSSQKNHVKNSYKETVRQQTKIIKEAEKSLKGDELKIIEEALEWLGTKYEYGKQEKGKSTDCSGFVMKVFEEAIGCKLPRNSAKQAEFCKEIKRDKLKPGDLVFFITNSGNKINHVGIMIDNLQFIHASTKGVLISTLESNYYDKHFIKAGKAPCLQH